jgi:GT2 family glycosyltransferase
LKTGIIILNWNDAPTTIECLNRLRAWQRLAPEIIVVDNGSDDGSAESISARHPDIHLVCSSINRGFAGGCNIGINKALEIGCGSIMLLNSDAGISEDDALTLLNQLQQSSSPIILGPAIKDNSSGREILTCGGRDIARHSHTRITCSSGRHSGQSEQIVDYVPGTVLLTTDAVFKKAGLLNEDFFFSGEIAEFCARARDAGIRSLINPAIVAEHTTSSSNSRLRNTLYTYYTLRNRFLYIKLRRYGTHLKLRWTAGGWAMLMLALISFNFGRARAIALALRDGLRGQWGNRNAIFGL